MYLINSSVWIDAINNHSQTAKHRIRFKFIDYTKVLQKAKKIELSQINI